MMTRNRRNKTPNSNDDAVGDLTSSVGNMNLYPTLGMDKEASELSEPPSHVKSGQTLHVFRQRMIEQGASPTLAE